MIVHGDGRERRSISNSLQDRCDYLDVGLRRGFSTHLSQLTLQMKKRRAILPADGAHAASVGNNSNFYLSFVSSLRPTVYATRPTPPLACNYRTGTHMVLLCPHGKSTCTLAAVSAETAPHLAASVWIFEILTCPISILQYRRQRSRLNPAP